MGDGIGPARALHMLLVGRVADRMAAPFLVAGGQFVVCGAISLAWAALVDSGSRQSFRYRLKG